MFDNRKKRLTLAMIAALGLPASAAADTINLSWSGVFTILSPNGQFVALGDPPCMPGMDIGNLCARSALTGTLTLDTVTGAGSGTIAPFSFGGQGNVVFTSLSLQKIGDGMGGPGSLVLGNMLWTWNANNGIPTSIVWDASGLLSAVNGGLSVGQNITGGALPASNNTELDSNGVPGGTTLPIGAALLATTIRNTTTIGTPTLGSYPSGTLPLVTDTVMDITNGDAGIGGSPMPTGPFISFNANLDILSAQVTNIEAVPIPATVWLFGSGLAGLVPLVRRKRGKPPTQAG